MGVISFHSSRTWALEAVSQVSSHAMNSGAGCDLTYPCYPSIWDMVGWLELQTSSDSLEIRVIRPPKDSGVSLEVYGRTASWKERWVRALRCMAAPHSPGRKKRTFNPAYTLPRLAARS